MATIVEIMDPHSHKITLHDITNIKEIDLDVLAVHMDPHLREKLHNELAPCSPAEFLAAWVECVGPETAGDLILGDL